MWLTKEQAAQELQVTVGVVESLIRSGRLKSTALSGRANVRIKQEDLANIAPPTKTPKKVNPTWLAGVRGKKKPEPAAEKKAPPKAKKEKPPEGKPVVKNGKPPEKALA